jgi:hypothetical protein
MVDADVSSGCGLRYLAFAEYNPLQILRKLRTVQLSPHLSNRVFPVSTYVTKLMLWFKGDLGLVVVTKE